MRRDFAAVNERLIGPVPAVRGARGADEGTFREPANLRKIEALQRALDAVPGVSATLSMVDVEQAAEPRARARRPAEERIPDYARGGGRPRLHGAEGRLPALRELEPQRGERDRADGRARLARDPRRSVARIEAEVARLGLEPALDVEVTGNAVVLNRSADQLAGNQISSIVLASATIFGLVYAVFRSFRFALLVMIPNVTPVILFFGLLGLGLAPLSLPTSMIGCSVLGVAVDDTIHSLVSYRRLRDLGATPEHAVLVTMREVGRPMVISSLMLIAGFLTITVSGFATIREFGWLSALTMVICLAADMVMLPALLVRARA